MSTVPLDSPQKAIEHALSCIREQPQIGYYAGLYTETFERLTHALAAMTNQSVDDVKAEYMPEAPTPAPEGYVQIDDDAKSAKQALRALVESEAEDHLKDRLIKILQNRDDTAHLPLHCFDYDALLFLLESSKPKPDSSVTDSAVLQQELSDLKARHAISNRLLSEVTTLSERKTTALDKARDAIKRHCSEIERKNAALRKLKSSVQRSIDLAGHMPGNPFSAQMTVIDDALSTTDEIITPDTWSWSDKAPPKDAADQSAASASLVDLLNALDNAHDSNPFLWFELGYTRPTDWMVHVWDRRGGGERKIISEQETSRSEACATAAEKLRTLYPVQGDAERGME